MITFQKKTDESESDFLQRIQFAENEVTGERRMRDPLYRSAVDKVFQRVHGNGSAVRVVEPPIRTEHDSL